MQPWTAIARGEIGQKEVPGRQHNPRIVEYHRAAGISEATDELPWCGSFLAWVFSGAGIPIPKGAAWAPAWANWGTACSASPDAVAVIAKRTAGPDAHTGSASGAHVGLIVSVDAVSIRLLGGNQGDQVKESTFPLSAYRIVATRWPAGQKGDS